MRIKASRAAGVAEPTLQVSGAPGAMTLVRAPARRARDRRRRPGARKARPWRLSNADASLAARARVTAIIASSTRAWLAKPLACNSLARRRAAFALSRVACASRSRAPTSVGFNCASTAPAFTASPDSALNVFTMPATLKLSVISRLNTSVPVARISPARAAGAATATRTGTACASGFAAGDGASAKDSADRRGRNGLRRLWHFGAAS